MSDETNGNLVVIAHTVKTRGLKGELVAELMTDFPQRFNGLEDVIAKMPDGTLRKLKIESFFFQKGRIVLKFAGVDSVETGAELKNADICVTAAESVRLESDEFFDWQLVGCMVETIRGEPVGLVREVMRTGGTEILVVDGTDKEYLIPFARAICVEVDIENEMIRVDPPEGLLEF